MLLSFRGMKNWIKYVMWVHITGRARLPFKEFLVELRANK